MCPSFDLWTFNGIYGRSHSCRHSITKTFSDLLPMYATSPMMMSELSRPLLNPLSAINTPARGSEGGEIALSLYPSPRAELELEAVSSDHHSPKDKTSRHEVPSPKHVAREVSPKHVRSVRCPRKEELKTSVRINRPPLRPSQVSNIPGMARFAADWTTATIVVIINPVLHVVVRMHFHSRRSAGSTRCSGTGIAEDCFVSTGRRPETGGIV